MKKYTAVFVYHPTPILGRKPLLTNLFGSFKEKEYVAKLNVDFEAAPLPWHAILDHTESDVDQLKEIADVIICAPGLEKQFISDDYPKNHLIFLTSLEYHANDTKRVIKILHEIEDDCTPS